MEMERSRLPDPPEIRQCLFLRAVEEADPAGERLSLAERIAATKTAAERERGLDFIRARVGVLGPRLKGPLAQAFAGVARQHGGLPGWTVPAIGAGASLLGWLTHELGREGRVSLLAFPLLGLIVWNLAVVAAALVGHFKKSRSAAPGWLAAWQRVPPPTGDELTDRVVARVNQEWAAVSAPAWIARGQRLFHTAALLLAAGVVAGMYARGLVKNYQATWESTFLTQPVVSKLTRIVLGPASILTGIGVPEVPPQGGLSSAAPWIHLWAGTAGLFILLPRLLLISMSGRKVARSGMAWADTFGDYEASARRMAEGQPLVARVLPVQCDPEPRLRDGLRAVLQHLWGGQVMIDFLPAVPYGEEDECLEQLTEAPTHLVLLLPMAVTPEDEVHGVLQRGLEKLMAKALVPPFALTVLDGAGFEGRLAGMPEAGRRMGERRSAWEKILGTAWPVLVLDSAARRDPASAAAAVASARQPLRLWTPAL